jgi:hypothetical protein
VLESALSPLFQAEEDEPGDQHCANDGGADIDTDLASRGDLSPFLREGLGRGLVQLLDGSRITPESLASLHINQFVLWRRPTRQP